MRYEQELMLLVRRDGGLPRHLLREIEHAEAGRHETAAPREPC